MSGREHLSMTDRIRKAHIEFTLNGEEVEVAFAPHKTLLEAAQIAAFFSRAKEQPKVAVHYTQKKFVNKPKGSGAGLVSLSSFKTILVEPKINEQQK